MAVDAPSPRLLALLAEKERRERERAAVEARRAEIAAFCASLRAIYYDKQRGFFTSRHRRRATRKTRRAGATKGGCREFLARALETSGWRGTYVTSTRIEARERAWRSDTRSGFIDLLEDTAKLLDGRQVTTFDICGIEVEVREQELALEFSNGSRINLFGADDEASLNKQRGLAKHVYWIDEAQDFRFLDQFYKAVIVAGLADFMGECWLTGTPGKFCVDMFYEVTRDDPTPEFAAAWEVHSMAVTDNPFFGATPEERWERTAGDAMRANGWKPDDPDLLREWFARWVTTDANYVYAVNTVPEAVQTFAPLRISEGWRQLAPLVRGMTPELIAVLNQTGWYDHAASLKDLPVGPLGQTRQWFFGVGMDFGRDPDPVAVSVLGFTPDLPDVFEMWAWKRTMLVPDDWRCIAEMLFLQITEGLVVMVGDPGGLVGAELVAWRERLGIPMEASDKAGKASWIEMLNGDIRRRRFHYRAGSPLLDEHKHLVWMPQVAGRRPKEYADRRLADGRVPGNHNSDSALYCYRHLSAHLHRPAPPPESQDAIEEQAIIQAMQRPARGPDPDGFLPVSMFGDE